MNNSFWKTQCSEQRFGIKGEIRTDIEAWEEAIQVYDQSWYWAYGWVMHGYPSPPAWFFKSRHDYLRALSGTNKSQQNDE